MNKTYYPNSFKFEVLNQIKQLPGSIVLRQDVKSLGSDRQVSRALRTLVEMGDLVKLGYGVYAKAYYSPRLKRPIIDQGFDSACLEALTRLGVHFEPSQADKAYNSGQTTQVPVRTVVHLKSRFRGHLSDGNRQLRFEDNINAR
ncbi:MAG: hypothetical protein ACHP9Y_02450 [Gammaproteobacteria bacterium]